MQLHKSSHSSSSPPAPGNIKSVKALSKIKKWQMRSKKVGRSVGLSVGGSLVGRKEGRLHGWLGWLVASLIPHVFIQETKFKHTLPKLGCLLLTGGDAVAGAEKENARVNSYLIFYLSFNI